MGDSEWVRVSGWVVESSEWVRVTEWVGGWVRVVRWWVGGRVRGLSRCVCG